MELFYFRYDLTPGLADTARALSIPEGQPFLLNERGSRFDRYCAELGFNQCVLESIPLSGADHAGGIASSQVPGVNEYLLYRTSTSKSRNTWKAEAEQIGIFLRWVKEQGKDWRDITLLDLRSFYRSRRLQPSPHTGKLISSKTWNSCVGALSRFYAWAVEVGILVAVPFTYRHVSIPTVGEVQKNTLTESAPDEPVRYVTLEEYKIFRDALGRSRNGERDKTFADTLLSTGLRISEGLSLTAATLPDPEAPRYKGLKSIPFLIRGKGAKTRTILFPKSALRKIEIYKGEERTNAIARWKFRHADRKRKSEPAALWLSERATPMSAARCEEIFGEASERCGIHCTPHMLRHTYAIYMLSALVEKTICSINELRREKRDKYSTLIHHPLRQLANLLGHANVSTTFIYLDFIERCEAIADGAVEQWTKEVL
jgi:site-specific recombinase XerD